MILKPNKEKRKEHRKGGREEGRGDYRPISLMIADAKNTKLNVSKQNTIPH